MESCFESKQFPEAIPGRRMPSTLRWVLIGESFPTLNFVALRLSFSSLLVSAARGQRAFKTARHQRIVVRIRWEPGRVKVQTRIVFHSAQPVPGHTVPSRARGTATDLRVLKC